MSAPLHVIFSQLSGILPFIGGLLRFKHLKKDTKILFLFFIIALLTEAIVEFLAHFRFHNLWLFHIFTIIEYVFLAFVFSYWQKENKVKKIIRWSTLLFICIWIINLIIHIEDLNEYNNVSRSIESILLTAIALFTLYNSYLESQILIYKNYVFWFSIGVLIYFSGNFMLFSLGKYIINGFDVGGIHSILNISANMCYLGGFLCILSH